MHEKGVGIVLGACFESCPPGTGKRVVVLSVVRKGWSSLALYGLRQFKNFHGSSGMPSQCTQNLFLPRSYGVLCL